MKDKNDFFLCRICGLRQDEMPWGADGKTPTYQICDCCGVEFGYEDCTVQSIENFRKSWLERGAKWFRESQKPEDWSQDLVRS
jgi:hypothetical protein